jgi:tetratricopeptide (TPR) repeat protein
MRRLVLALAAVLAVPAAAGAQQTWATAYRDGVEAFEKGNLALAEQKMLEAREHSRAPKQARRANFSSVDFRPFIPDFYLGVIYARQGRYKQAQEYLERAIRDELVKPDDRANYALATSSLQRARDEQTRLAANTATRPTPPAEVRPPANTSTPPATNTTPPATSPNTQPPATTPGNSNTPANSTTPPVTRPVPPSEPAWLPRFRQNVEAARTSLRQSRYAEARSSAAAAAALPVDAVRRQEVESLKRDIDMAQSVEATRVAGRVRAAIQAKNPEAALEQVAALRTIAPEHPSLPDLQSSIERLRGTLKGVADLARVERLGVKLFLSGNYKDSAAELDRAVKAGVESPRIYLFLASSRAAQALLAPQAERPALVDEARRLYARAKPGAAALTTDQRFISQSILQLLAGG